MRTARSQRKNFRYENRRLHLQTRKKGGNLIIVIVEALRTQEKAVKFPTASKIITEKVWRTESTRRRQSEREKKKRIPSGEAEHHKID